MSLTKEEMLELAHENICGAVRCAQDSINGLEIRAQLESYTSALEQRHTEYEDNLRTKLAEYAQRHLQDRAKEQKCQAQIAMLVEAWKSNDHRRMCLAVADRQQSAKAWEREVKAGALEDMPEGWAEAVNLAYNIHTDLVAPENVSKKGIKELAAAIMSMDAKAAELRNQAQVNEPRKPCTCDGRCDGFCLEGKEKGK